MKMNATRLFFIALIAVTACGCEQDPCAQFQRKIVEPGMAARLESWVDTHSKADLSPAAKSPGKVRYPGEYEIPLNLNPEQFGLPPDAEARVVLNADRSPAYVFLGARNYQGIVVKVGNEASYAIPANLLKGVTDRTSTVCMKRD